MVDRAGARASSLDLSPSEHPPANCARAALGRYGTQLVAFTLTPSTEIVTFLQLSWGVCGGQLPLPLQGRKQVPLDPQKPERHCEPVVQGSPEAPLPAIWAHDQLTDLDCGSTNGWHEVWLETWLKQ
jgi:hypothetical protein